MTLTIFDVLALSFGISLIVGLILGRVLKWCDQPEARR